MYKRQAFRRRSKKQEELITIVNFSPVPRENYRIGVPFEGEYEEIFNSDLEEYGGWGNVNAFPIPSEEIPLHSYPQSIALTVPPLAVAYFKVHQKMCIRDSQYAYTWLQKIG